MSDSCHPKKKKSFDYLMWLSVIGIVVGYFFHLYFGQSTWVPAELIRYGESTFSLVNKMFWGLILAIFFVGVLNRVPREFIMAVLGGHHGLKGLFRAALAGVLLDLCSHGILLVGMKLYERGATLGQTMAFLIASPWNSLSLTIILISLVGLKWTLAFIGLSFLIAMITGLVFDSFVRRGILPKNRNIEIVSRDFKLFPALKKKLSHIEFNLKLLRALWSEGLKGSRMILRWVFFGVVMAALIRAFVDPESFQTYFGASLGGLGLTLLIATVLEVCSEGSAPIAAEILNSAKAPGNAFIFLMAGVATDYTEIMALKETTKSWKISLFLPLITVPQILVVGYLLNGQ